MTTLTTAAAATTTSRSEPMRRSFVLARPLIWGALALASGCSKKQAPEGANASAQTSLPDLPEPSSLVAEIALPQPGATYRALRELGSPVASLLPAGFPMFAATMLGLPPLSADSFDSDVASVGAIAQRAGGGLGVVLALHVVSGRELVAKLTTGAQAPFRAQIGEPLGLTALASSTPDAGAASASTQSPLALGVFDNYFVVATDRELLGSVGPYVARTLPRRPLPQHALALRASQHALVSSAVPALRSLWAGFRTLLADRDRAARAEHGGRAPDFGDPAQVILGLDTAAEAALSVLENAQSLEVDLDPEPSRLTLSFALSPAPGSPAQAALTNFAHGNAQALLALPLDTRFAFGSTSSTEARDAAAQAAGDDWVRLLGSRLSEPDTKKLRAALTDWELGHGKQATYGFIGGNEPGVFVTTDVTDAVRLEHAGHGLFGLFALPAVRAPFAEFGGEPHVTESTVTRSGYARPVQLAQITFSRSATAKKDAPLPPIACAWLVAGETASFVAGKEAEPLLARLTDAARGTAPRLGGNAAVASGVARLGEGTAVFAYADARVAAERDSEQPAPVLLGFGQRDQTALLRVEISKPALDIALQRVTGF